MPKNPGRSQEPTLNRCSNGVDTGRGSTATEPVLSLSKDGEGAAELYGAVSGGIARKVGNEAKFKNLNPVLVTKA